jgi:hypothetical protein
MSRQAGRSVRPDCQNSQCLSRVGCRRRTNPRSVSLETMPITSRVPFFTHAVMSNYSMVSLAAFPFRRAQKEADLGHRRNRHGVRAVSLGDRVRAEPAILLGSIPVELDGTHRPHARADERAERGEDCDRPGPVVVRAGRSRRGLAVVLAVQVRADAEESERGKGTGEASGSHHTRGGRVRTMNARDLRG